MIVKHSLQSLLASFCVHYLVCIISVTYSLSLSENETDRLSLLEFKAKINQDPFGAFESWNDTLHFCQWYGVACGQRHQRVTVLNLQSLQLSGSISPFIGNLSFLRELNLQNNSLIGGIPPQIGRLRRLQTLLLGNNSLGGEIPPNISFCSNLLTIIIYNNQLEGSIPPEVGFFTKLVYLHLGINNLNGTIPPALGNMSSLQVLALHLNNLVGRIPVALGNLIRLRGLYLNGNELSGSVPSCIFNLSSLVGLDLGENYISGTLPSDLGTLLPNLLFLSFSINQLTGYFPVSISNLSNLQILQLTTNSLVGQVPSLEKLVNLQAFRLSQNHIGTGQAGDLNFLSSLTNASGLRYLNINTNNFGGTIPKEIGNLSVQLYEFLLNNNQLVGSLPIEIGNLVNLERFEVWNNRLSGPIPSSIGKLQRIQVLHLERNNFTGNIPSSVGNLTNVISLSLRANVLQGSIPSTLLNCQNLLGLDLSKNNLSGTIPPEIMGITSLTIYLDLAYNLLVGALPEEVGALKNLEVIAINNNNLSGEIPATLGSCGSLQSLYMGGNHFQGSIPSSLVSLKGLVLLDLSYNNLSGAIPNFFEGLKLLEILDLSYNDFEGAIPTGGIFMNASAFFVVGNPRVCGDSPELNLPRCPTSESNKRTSNKMKIVLGAIGAILALAFMILGLLVYSIRRKKRVTVSSHDGKEFYKLSYASLLKATNDFSSTNLIGSGGFGSVYKGTLDPEGTIVAVKVLDLTKRGASRSFIAECESLKNIRHRNLVKVLTACSSVDHEGNDFKALVYEFMANGSLEEWLHPSQPLHETPKVLSLVQRLNLSIDVAYALEYLHHECGTTMVHCDLKPSNVLLDEEMVGHLSDFGLSKFLPENSYKRQTSQSTSIGLRGTVGYAPPEYGLGSEVNVYGDIYSYGILLLEIFTGKRPTNAMFKDGLTLRSFVESAVPERVAEVVDEAILEIKPEEWEDGNHEIMECLGWILQIGITCSSQSPNDRIKMGAVVSQLSSIRNIHFKRERPDFQG